MKTHRGGMMRDWTKALLVLAALSTAACNDSGGELREVTQRRRGELDTTSVGARDTDATDDTSRLPAFTDDSAPVAATTSGADTAKKDTAKAAVTPPTPPAAGWTAGALSRNHPEVRAILRGLRAASNTGFDRLVLDFGDQGIPSWSAKYADQLVRQCGSGDPVELGTGAVLRIRLNYTQAHDDAGRPTIRQRDLQLSMPVMKRMVVICDFEGEVEIAIAAASQQPYRISELSGPSRLVVDLQQQP